MNWILIFAVLALTSPISIYLGLKQARTETGEAAALAQFGYFSALIGICGSLAQFLSLDAVMYAPRKQCLIMLNIHGDFSL